MRKGGLTIAAAVTFAIIFIASLLYTSGIQSTTGMGDMRSRVVGARLVKDDKLPYFYNWHPGEPLRYFGGPVYFDSLAPGQKIPSNVTVSPLFLHGMAPFVDAAEYKIDWGSFVLFHLLFLISLGLALWYSRKKQWPLILLLFAAFLWTDGWIYHFYVIQQYIQFGFLFVLITLLLLRNKQVAAGLLFALLFLLRMNTLLFAVPLLLLALRYRRFFLSSFAGVTLYAVFALLNPFERQLWQEYFASLKIHQANHMIADRAAVQGTVHPMPEFLRNFEGADYIRLEALGQERDFKINKESSNFKDAWEAVAHRYPPVIVLQLLLLGSIGVLMLWWLLRYKKEGRTALEPYRLLLTGLLFYFLSNFFSTFSTVPYHLPQWFAVAFLYALAADRLRKPVFLLFFAGLLLNFHFFPGFKGRHLLAEMLLLASLLGAVLLPERRAPEAAPGASIQL